MDEALVKRLKASWRVLTNIVSQPIESLKWGETGEITKIRVDMADKQEIGRPMKFPYTFTAKVAQFPWKFYFTRQWIWKYYAISLVVCLPVFAKISKLANSPENVAKWAEIRRKEAEEHHH